MHSNQKTRIRTQAIRQVLTSTVVWLPFVLGAFIAMFSPGDRAIGWAGMAAGALAAAWKFTVGFSGLEMQLADRAWLQQSRQHQRYLRQLQRKLRQDRDPDSGKLLLRLKRLRQRMDRLFCPSLQPEPWVLELQAKMQRLYESGLSGLENSFRIWLTARDVQSETLSESLNSDRQNLLNEVAESVNHLENSLDSMQVSALENELPADEFAELRRELDRGLEMAANIDRRIRELDQQVGQAIRGD
ncbi:MAG: hypothetical protein R3C28_23465 [Pirellulaceae bacterium]